MRRITRRLLLGMVLAGGAALAWPRPPAAGQPPDTLPEPARHDRWMGVATCSSTACHNANGPRANPWRSEYSIWAANDRHSRAFQVLYDERSTRMVRLLYGDKADATKQKECLACHATGEGDTAGVGPSFQLADGVGCESCHGAAERWLTVHYQDEFRRKSAEEKESLGLRDLRDVRRRARMCTECHVGSPGRDVNHDLIAAGHPRLNFEYAGFLGVYPKHWDVAQEKRKAPDLAAREWVLGQLATAQASLELLEMRAREADKGRAPWPEFAEYNCFACHKDLKADSARQKAGYGGRVPGSLPWGTWYLSMILPYAQASGADVGDLGKAVDQLRNQMQRPRPSPSAVRGAARALRQDLTIWASDVHKSKAMSAEDIRALMAKLVKIEEKHAKGLDWDQATQLYLALAALHQGMADRGLAPPPAVTQDLLAIRSGLKGSFVPGFDSPRNFDPRSRPALEERLLDIGKHLGE